MIYLRQSTASQEVPLGYFVDSSDGDTEKGSLSIANTDIKLWKTGATTLANKNSGGATSISGGIYYCTLDATDTDTIGPMVIFVHVATALTVRLECCVLDEAVYDVLFGTTAPSTLAAGASMALTGAAVDAILDDATDGSVTLRQLMRGIASALMGKLSGAATTTVAIRDLADTKDRISATVDADGNRTAVTLDLT